MSDRPKDGIYLDATLAVIGEHVSERIDEVSRRRRVRARLGIVALAVATVTSGSLAAVALTSPAVDTTAAAPTNLTVSAELRCVDGFDPTRPAYFTVSYRTTDDAEVDRERACGAARTALAADDAEVASATPAELVTLATKLIGESMDAGGAADASREAAAVDEASFGRLSPVGGTRMVVCDDETVSIVLATSLVEAPTALQRSALCASVGGVTR